MPSLLTLLLVAAEAETAAASDVSRRTPFPPPAPPHPGLRSPKMDWALSTIPHNDSNNYSFLSRGWLVGGGGHLQGGWLWVAVVDIVRGESEQKVQRKFTFLSLYFKQTILNYDILLEELFYHMWMHFKLNTLSS